MTRKKYIKVLMSLGVQRNEAHRMAAYQRQQHGSYTDIRADGLPSLHLFGIRCALIARTIVDKVTDAVILCSTNMVDLDQEIGMLSGIIGEAAGRMEKDEEFEI